MELKTLISEMINKCLNEQYKVADKEVFNDHLLDLTTLDLEDEQVRYPSTNNRKLSHLFSDHNYDLYVLDRSELPSSGAFEIIITNNSDEIIGFIRGIKGSNIVSFNMIHINPNYRGSGIGSSIYTHFLNRNMIIKSDKEITDATYSVYDKLVRNGYKPLVFLDGSVGLMK